MENPSESLKSQARSVPDPRKRLEIAKISPKVSPHTAAVSRTHIFYVIGESRTHTTPHRIDILQEPEKWAKTSGQRRLGALEATASLHGAVPAPLERPPARMGEFFCDFSHSHYEGRWRGNKTKKKMRSGAPERGLGGNKSAAHYSPVVASLVFCVFAFFLTSVSSGSPASSCM